MLLRHNYYIILLALCIFALPARAQQTHAGYDHYSVADGLPSHTVYYCVQDRNGYLWLGTDAGVTRFDGKHFVNYTTDDGLGANEILDLYEDRSGRVWFLPFSGRLSYYSGGTLHDPDKDSILKQIKFSYQLDSPVEDREGNLYFLEKNKENGILLIRKNGVVQDLKLHSFMKPGDRIEAIHKDKHGKKLYIFTVQNNALCISGKTPVAIFPSSLSGLKSCHHFVSNPKSKMQLSFNDEGIYAWEDTTPVLLIHFKQCPLLNPPLNPTGNTLFMDPENNIWLARAHTPLFLFRFMNGRYDAGNEILRDKNSIVSFDRENQLWFCTQTDGVYKIPYQKFLNLQNAFSWLQFTDKPITSVFVSPDRHIWLGTNDGNIIMANDRKFQYYHPDNGHYNRVLQLTTDRNGNILAATDESLLRIRKTGNGYSTIARIARYDNGEQVLGALKGFTTDTEGTIYPLIAYISWQIRLKPQAEYLSKSRQLPELMHFRVFSHFIDTRNKHYLSTVKGIGFMQQDSIVYLPPYARYKGSMINSYIETPDGTILMASAGDGILAVKNDRIITSFDQHDGLQGLVCRKIYARNDTLYIATNMGITMARYQLGKFIILGYLTVNDGLLSDDVNDLAFIDNTLLVATSEGLSAISIRDNKRQATPPVVRVQHLLVNDSDYIRKALIAFPFRQQHIRISFNAPTLDRPGQIQYRYRLSRKDAEWQELQNNEVEFVDLPYGRYHFEVQARKYNSAWSRSAEVYFTITPPFYATWWFCLLTAAIIIAGFMLGIRYLLRKRLARQMMLHKQQQALEAERNRIASDLHDDIGSELTNIIMLSNMLKQEDTDNQNLLSRLEQSSDSAIRKMNEVIWTLHAQDDTLHNLAAYMRSESRKYLKEHGLEHTLLIDESVYVPLPVSAVFRRHVTLMLKEILHNIVKHARASNVVISISLPEHKLELRITDDGVGFDHTRATTGNGLRNLRKRVAAMKGQCSITSGKGTVIHIILPLNEAV